MCGHWFTAEAVGMPKLARKSIDAAATANFMNFCTFIVLSGKVSTTRTSRQFRIADGHVNSQNSVAHFGGYTP